MKVGIVDADLLGRHKHRFPNLVCEKLSAYWKAQGAEVSLITDYDSDVELVTEDEFRLSEEQLDLFGYDNLFSGYDLVYVSKVFTDTPAPRALYNLLEHFDEFDDNGNLQQRKSDRIQIGGTGFFFDKAPNLNYKIEHHMPDYHLYDTWIQQQVDKARQSAQEEGRKFNLTQYMVQYKEYTDYSIGFLTRGCFRKCKFCVNQKYSGVFKHSPLEEFYDPARKKICLLDDNFLGCPNWRPMLQTLIDTGKPFKFKQGLDERLLTEEKCQMLFNSNYDGDFTFAFDNYSDYELIHKKLQLIYKYHIHQNVKFYILVGFESTDIVDIEHAFSRIELLFRYGCLPYIMRYQNKNDRPCTRSKYSGVYITLARWCNQPSFVKKLTFREFCEKNQSYQRDPNKICSSMRALKLIEADCPDIALKYFDMRFGENITRRSGNKEKS